MVMKTCFLGGAGLAGVLLSLLISQDVYCQVKQVPSEIRASFKLDPYYQKYVDVRGLPVVGSKRVTDAAILEAAWIVEKMIGHRPELLAVMAENRTRLAVMAFDEYTTDVPEHRHLTPRVYWDRRARGLGATPRAPAVSCAEENLLGHPGDPYETENICIHEFGHAIHEMGMVTLDPTFDERLKLAYRRAKTNGLWENTYAITNHKEYWAEAVQSWFGNNREQDALHNHVNTRQELLDYDPPLATLCREVFGEKDWRYHKPLDRPHAERSHLLKVDFESLPRFRWRDEAAAKRPKVLFQTSQGDFEIELQLRSAPSLVAALLRDIHEGLYSDGVICDDVHQSGIAGLALLQFQIDSSKKDGRAKLGLPKKQVDLLPKELDGAVLMVRENGDSGACRLVVCFRHSEQGPNSAESIRLNGMVVGKVRSGRDTLEKVWKSLANDRRDSSDVKIQRAIRLN